VSPQDELLSDCLGGRLADVDDFYVTLCDLAEARAAGTGSSLSSCWF